MSANDPAYPRSGIEAWLLAERWKIDEIAHPQAHWVLRAEDPAARVFVIGLGKEPGDQLRIQADIAVEANHQQLFAGLPPRRQAEFLWELRFRLLAANIDFKGVSQPLTRVSLFKNLYLDGLTKHVFMHALGEVRNALLAVVWSLRREFEEQVAPIDTDTLLH